METKEIKTLNLRMNGKVIDRAKNIAKDKGVSLSTIVERFLQAYSDIEEKKINYSITPFVNALNVDSKIDIPNNFDYKSYIANIIMEKHN